MNDEENLYVVFDVTLDNTMTDRMQGLRENSCKVKEFKVSVPNRGKLLLSTPIKLATSIRFMSLPFL